MSDKLAGLLINIIAIVVFANMAYMIMPESNLKKFVKLVLGLIVIISIMASIIVLFTAQDTVNIFILN